MVNFAQKISEKRCAITSTYFLYSLVLLALPCYAYDIAAYKIGQSLTTQQAKKFLEKYNNRPTQNWATPSQHDIPLGAEGKEIRQAIQLLTQTSLGAF